MEITTTNGNYLLYFSCCWCLILQGRGLVFGEAADIPGMSAGPCLVGAPAFVHTDFAESLGLKDPGTVHYHSTGARQGKYTPILHPNASDFQV